MKTVFAIAATVCISGVLAAGPSDAQERITYGQAVQGLFQSAETARKMGIDVDAVRRDIEARIKAEGGDNASSPPSVAAELKKLPNFIVQIQFNLGSDVIRPESWVTVGRIADALHHPLLLGDRFLVVGNTDASGTRQLNLELSQKRALAVVEMLVTVFRVAPERLLALGLGEEALFDQKNPLDGVNRRVELFNIGPL